MNLLFFLLFIFISLISCCYNRELNDYCLNNCNGKGNCQTDICTCAQGYINIDCSIEAQFINFYPKSEGNITLHQGDKKYFVIDLLDPINRAEMSPLFTFFGQDIFGISYVLEKNFEYPGGDWEYDININNMLSLFPEKWSFYLYDLDNLTLSSVIIMFTTQVPQAQLSYSFGENLHKNSRFNQTDVLYIILFTLGVILSLLLYFFCKRHNKKLKNQEAQQKQQIENQVEVHNNNQNQNTETISLNNNRRINNNIDYLARNNIDIDKRTSKLNTEINNNNNQNNNDNDIDSLQRNNQNSNSNNNNNNNMKKKKKVEKSNNNNKNNEISEEQKLQMKSKLREKLKRYMPDTYQDKKQKQEYQAESCSVCLEKFSTGKKKVNLTICQHLFHRECLISWMQKQQNCPVCRHELKLKQLKNCN